MVHGAVYLRCTRRHQGAGKLPRAGVRPPTVGEWLEEWLAAKKKLRAATVRSYESHIRLYLGPCIGHIPLDRLRVADVGSVFDYIDDLNDAVTAARVSGDPERQKAFKGRRLVGPASCQRIRATLRSAIGAYMRQHPGALPANVAALVELAPGPRPKGLVWTGERVRSWQLDFEVRLAAARAAGGRVDPVGVWVSAPRPSPVMVWTPEQTAVFLKAAGRHRLHALWRLIATRGLRRGEGCGLRRSDTDLSVALTTVRWQITQLGWKTVQGAPKSDAGDRTIALDAGTVADIRRHRREHDRERESAGDAWAGSGFEFTGEHGGPLHPADVTYAFHMIAYLAGLPPVRLHDLRHGAATMLLAAGHGMKVVQETLGLSSITIAGDTYTSVLPQLARQSAEDVAALVCPSRIPSPRRRSGERQERLGSDGLSCKPAM
jgi:integrase